VKKENYKKFLFKREKECYKLFPYIKGRDCRVSNDLVVMDNSIVKASYNLSVSEQRLLLSALAQIPKNQPIDPKQAYYITRDDFVRLGANADQATRDIRNATKDLMKKTLLIDTSAGVLEFHWLSEVLRFDKNADARLKLKYPNPEDYKNYLNGLRKYNLLESLPFGRHSDDIVARVVFDSRILPLLSELKDNFTQFLLNDVSGFGSVYSFRFYQMMMQFKSTGYCKISLNDLRYSLALFEKYEATKDLRKWVIETAVNEINEKTPYKVSYELLKTGRKFTHLELKFKQKPKPKLIAPERDTKIVDMFSNLSDSQIKTYSSILSKLHSISDLADNKDYPAFAMWIGNILRDPTSVREETAKRIFKTLRTETDFKD
jgi:plasmid replication initiation protein